MSDLTKLIRWLGWTRYKTVGFTFFNARIEMQIAYDYLQCPLLFAAIVLVNIL